MTTDAITCQFWEGPMHGQFRTLKIEQLRANGNTCEVMEYGPGPIRKNDVELLTHIYHWPGGNQLVYQGRKQ